jgi:hypothetical protein
MIMLNTKFGLGDKIQAPEYNFTGRVIAIIAELSGGITYQCRGTVGFSGAIHSVSLTETELRDGTVEVPKLSEQKG